MKIVVITDRARKRLSNVDTFIRYMHQRKYTSINQRNKLYTFVSLCTVNGDGYYVVYLHLIEIPAKNISILSLIKLIKLSQRICHEYMQSDETSQNNIPIIYQNLFL